MSTVATVLATAAAPATLVVVATQPGCFLFGSPGPSTVGQGHKYVSGNPDYDDYFSQLYDLQVEMAKAPDTEKEIRSKLAKKLGLDPDSSAALLAHKVRKEAKKIADGGVGLKIDVKGGGDTPGSAKLETAGGTLSGKDKRFADAVEQAVDHAQKLVVEMKKSHKLLDQLRAKTIDLKAKVDDVFRKGGLAKRAEVKKNLKDADTMITLMVARADDVSDAASRTVRRLTQAIHTDHGQFKSGEAKGEGAVHREPEKKPHWHPPPHSGAAPPAEHKPPPKKPASPPPSDFEP